MTIGYVITIMTIINQNHQMTNVNNCACAYLNISQPRHNYIFTISTIERNLKIVHGQNTQANYIFILCNIKDSFMRVTQQQKQFLWNCGCNCRNLNDLKSIFMRRSYAGEQ